MAETFDLFLIPPADKWKDVVLVVLNTLTDGGWVPDSMLLRDPQGVTSDILPAFVPGVVEAESASIGFRKGRHWLGVATGFNIPGRLEIGSDNTFFENIDPIGEIRTSYTSLSCLKEP